MTLRFQGSAADRNRESGTVAQAHTGLGIGLVADGNAGACAYGDQKARGYVTIDVVQSLLRPQFRGPRPAAAILPTSSPAGMELPPTRTFCGESTGSWTPTKTRRTRTFSWR